MVSKAFCYTASPEASPACSIGGLEFNNVGDSGDKEGTDASPNFMLSPGSNRDAPSQRSAQLAISRNMTGNEPRLLKEAMQWRSYDRDSWIPYPETFTSPPLDDTGLCDRDGRQDGFELLRQRNFRQKEWYEEDAATAAMALQQDWFSKSLARSYRRGGRRQRRLRMSAYEISALS